MLYDHSACRGKRLPLDPDTPFDPFEAGFTYVRLPICPEIATNPQALT
jgi:hypothetical protein